jgi:hypothetical protein
MVGLGPLFTDIEPVTWLLRDADGNVRSALICWGVALSAFTVFRVPPQVVLACLFIGTATVGFASLIADAAPVQAVASSPKPQPPQPAN